MKVYWEDSGSGVSSDAAREATLEEVALLWSDEVHGVKGNFLGLIDDQNNTVQFYLAASIPDDVEDASHLSIVVVDFPQPERQGSYTAQVTIGEVQGLIDKAFAVGADYHKFEGMVFQAW